MAVPRSSNTSGSVASSTKGPADGGPGGNSLGGSQAYQPSTGSKSVGPHNNGLTPSYRGPGAGPAADYGSAVFGSWPTTDDQQGQPPGGGYPTGLRHRGGGGGGGGKIDFQPWFDQWSGYKPQEYEYTPYEYEDFEYDDYEGPGFYDWDPSIYDTAKAGIKTGVAGATQAAGNALDRVQGAYSNMGNGFSGANVARQGGLSPSIQRSMADYGDDGAGGELTSQNAGLNRGMDAYLDMLAGGSEDYRQHMMASVEGDRASMLDRMGMAEVTMTMGVEMAMVKAKSQYDKDLWQYGEQIAQQNYQKNLAIAQANNAGRNQANIANNQGINQAAQANILAQNTNDQWLMNSVLDIISGRGKLDTSGFDINSRR